MERERHSLFMSNIFRFTTEIRDMISIGTIREEVAKAALEILNGKAAVNKEHRTPAPWSDDAKSQAKLYTWEHQYKDDPRYKKTATPFEELLENCDLK